MRSIIIVLVCILLVGCSADEGREWGLCTAIGDPIIEMNNTHCRMKGRYQFSGNNEKGATAWSSCEGWGWVHSARQPKGCIRSKCCLEYDGDGIRDHPVTVFTGWCNPLEGLRFEPTWDKCTVAGHVIVATNLDDLKKPRNSGQVFYVNKSCEEDAWVMMLSDPARCVAILDSAGVRFYRVDDAPKELPQVALYVSFELFCWLMVLFMPIALFSAVHGCFKRIDPSNVCLFTGLINPSIAYY